MKLLLFIIPLFFLVGSCAVRTYHPAPKTIHLRYKAVNTYQADGGSVYVKQLMKYDRPLVADDERAFGIIFSLDTGALTEGKVFNLPQDSVCLKHKAALPFTRNVYGDPNLTLEGLIKVVSVAQNKIVLRQKFRVIDSVQKKRGGVVRGKRTFRLDTSKIISLYFD